MGIDFLPFKVKYLPFNIILDFYLYISLFYAFVTSEGPFSSIWPTAHEWPGFPFGFELDNLC